MRCFFLYNLFIFSFVAGLKREYVLIITYSATMFLSDTIFIGLNSMPFAIVSLIGLMIGSFCGKIYNRIVRL